MKKFNTKMIAKARKKHRMTRADLVRELQTDYPLCSNQTVWNWETKGMVPSAHYQELLIEIFEQTNFFTRPVKGLVTR